MEFNGVDSEVTNSQIETFIDSKGSRAGRVIKSFLRYKEFKNAISTPLGQELLLDVMELLEDRLEKIINEEDTVSDRAEYRVLKEISKRWARKIAKYQSHFDEIVEQTRRN